MCVRVCDYALPQLIHSLRGLSVQRAHSQRTRVVVLSPIDSAVNDCFRAGRAPRATAGVEGGGCIRVRLPREEEEEEEEVNLATNSFIYFISKNCAYSRLSDKYECHCLDSATMHVLRRGAATAAACMTA